MNKFIHARRANAMLRFVSLGNREAIRAENERELMDAVCRQAVETQICAAAQILVCTELDGGVFEPVSQAGIDLSGSACLPEIARTLDWTHLLAVPTLVGKEVPGMAELGTQGIASLLMLPIAVEGKYFGVVALADTESQQFPEGELSALMQFAEDLGFSIETLRTRRRQDAREQMATHLLEHDAATGLPTRTLLKKHLDELIVGMAVKRSPHRIADRRFWHRPFGPRLPAAAARHDPQDRPVLRAADTHRSGIARHRPHRDPAGPQHRHEDGGRGHRVSGDPAVPARFGMRHGAGFPYRQADAGGGISALAGATRGADCCLGAAAGSSAAARQNGLCQMKPLSLLKQPS